VRSAPAPTLASARIEPFPARAEPAVLRTPASTAPIAWKTVAGIKAGDRPLVVWVADDVRDAAVERRAFDDADVRVASHAFRVVRIAPSDALTDPVLAPHARSAPALLVLAPDLSRGTITVGASIDAKNVLAAMSASATTYLKVDLAASVAKARALLDEQKSLESERASLDRTPPTGVAESARRTSRLGTINARLATIRGEIDGVFRPTHA
jgi:hypothetical protein